MTHNKYILALVCAAAIMFNSCGEDFLYLPPRGSVVAETLENELGLDMLVITAYSTFTHTGWGASLFNWTFGGIYGGDANKGTDMGDQAVLNDLEVYNVSSTNTYLNEKWSWVYRGSKRVEIALQVMEKVTDMSASKLAYRNAELHFLRALFYFEGVKVFGPYMPYLDETNAESNPKRHNDQDIYPNILADIDIAIANFPKEKASEPGRAYYWAAVALKAKILMQLDRMSDAKPLLKDLLDNGVTATGLKYALTDNLNDNWDCLMENKSSESIFEIQFSNDGTNNGNPGMSLCYLYGGEEGGGCCGFYQPSFELANSFQVDTEGLPFLDNSYRNNPSITRIEYLTDAQIKAIEDAGGDRWDHVFVHEAGMAVDPRLDFTVGRHGIPYKDWGPGKGGVWIRDMENGGAFMPKKHVYTKADQQSGRGSMGMHDNWAPGSTMNLQYLSVRDAMLLYAECLANDGDYPAAMDLVNKIRTRAANPVNIIKHEDGTPAANYLVAQYPNSHVAFSDKATCIAAVRMERKLELAMEGQRWFDLARWGGTYMSQAIREYLDYESLKIPNGKFLNVPTLAPEKTFFPVPNEQIAITGKDENGQWYLQQQGPWVSQQPK